MFSKTATRVVTTNMCFRTSGKITNHTVCNNLLQATDDSRPYHVRRVDAKLCEQDVAQGFKDRRLREIVIDMSIPVRLIAPTLDGIVTYAPMTPTSTPPNEPCEEEEEDFDFDIAWSDELARRGRLRRRREFEEERARLAEEEEERVHFAEEKERTQRRTRLVQEIAEEEAQRQLLAEAKMKKFEEERIAKKQMETLPKPTAPAIKTPVVIKSSITQNPDMVIKMRHWFGYKQPNGCVVSDEFYQEHVQFIRDQVSFDQESSDQIVSDQIIYGTQMQPTRRRRIIVDL